MESPAAELSNVQKDMFLEGLEFIQRNPNVNLVSRENLGLQMELKTQCSLVVQMDTGQVEQKH